MSEDNVWSPGDEAPGARTARPSGMSYGEGLWINQAFSLDVAFRLGLALLRERPGLMLGTGAAVWFLINLPSFLSLPGGVAAGVLEAGGDQQTADLVDLGNNLATLAFGIALFPVQWFVITGALRSIARYVETDDADTTALWSSWTQTAWVILYRIMSSFLMIVLVGIVFTPFAVGFGVLAWQGAFEAGLLVLLLGCVALAALGIGVALPLALGSLACAIDGVTAPEAFSIAWRAGSGARATLFVFGLVFGVLWIVGFCLFCVGQVPVYALLIGAAGGGWVLYSRPQEVLARSAFLRRNLPDLT